MSGVGTRTNCIINQACGIGIRNIYNGVLQDIYQLNYVQIQNPQGQVILTIPPEDVLHPELGVYETLIPAGILTYQGVWHDVWNFQPVPTSAVVNRRFNIEVSVVEPAPAFDYRFAVSCSLDDLSACVLKKYFLWPVWQVLSNGYYLPDQVLQYNIDAAMSWVTRVIGVPLKLTRVATPPFTSPLQYNVDYDEEGRLIPWTAPNAAAWSSFRLPHTNIVRLRAIRGVYGGKTIYNIPYEWFAGNELGQGWVYIRPTSAGNIAQIVDNNGQFLDVTLLESIGNISVPGFWAVDYDYGFNKDMRIPKEICDIIFKKAAVNLLAELGQAIGRGLTGKSASVDGLSSSLNFVANAERTIFSALATQYAEDLREENLVNMRRYYKGMSVFIA